MRIGLFTALFGDKPLSEALDIAQSLGLGAVEIGAGAYPGSPHLDVNHLLQSKKDRDLLMKQITDRGMILSAISVHGNPLHPVKSIAEEHHEAFVNAVKLAHALEIDCVNGFSGCPGDGPGAKNPNWVTCAWPDEYREILDWQWRKKVVPYWKSQAAFLAEHKVRFGIEMHPGFVVYNNDTLLKLRKMIGKNGDYVGANFDPSHLWWQGIDPIAAVRELGSHGAIVHVHAKDARVDTYNSGKNGNLDTKSYGDILNRSWVFRSVGYGHGVEWWKDFVSNLRMVGYDFVMSIEHEDGLMSPMEGLTKAVDVLNQAMIQDPAGEMFWAKD
ncbi:sugar phosphate isomerase/epimerase [Kamptonema cortianum]|nr:sugar phosphate isomerase/epimerase [Geitlerinema splendidum]MDK3158624.1 sugar phosphate isomerase/epimerase [Kamptonema cortianum]